VGETFTLAEGQQLRIVAIDPEIAEEFRDAGFNAIFYVEPLASKSDQ
jgi:anti-anti-sigma regulatory factor